MMTGTDPVTERGILRILTNIADRQISIDQRLERIEDKLTRAELTFAGFLAGPGKKLMRLFGNGGDAQ